MIRKEIQLLINRINQLPDPQLTLTNATFNFSKNIELDNSAPHTNTVTSQTVSSCAQITACVVTNVV